MSQLGLGDSIHISDLNVSEDLTILHDPDDTIVTVLAPRVEEVVEEAVELVEGEIVEKAEAEEKVPEAESEEQEQT